MPNIISRYSHAGFRRSLGRRRYSGRHGLSVPAMEGAAKSDMFEVSSNFLGERIFGNVTRGAPIGG